MNVSNKMVAINRAQQRLREGSVKAFANKGYRVWGILRDAGMNAELGAYSSQVSVIDMTDNT